MYRDFLTSKWVLGGFAFLIVFGVACVFWYHYDTAPYKRDAAKTAELMTQLKQSKNVQKDVKSTPVSPAIDEITETLITEITETEVELPESPYGFGHYPKVPQSMRDIGYNPIWENPNWETYSHATEGELLSRVRIKAWEEGKESIAASIDYKTGLVILDFPNTIYVWYGENINPKTGKTQRYFTQVAGMSLSIGEMMNGTVPEGVTVLDGETSGIDPYEYLNLSK